MNNPFLRDLHPGIQFILLMTTCIMMAFVGTMVSGAIFGGEFVANASGIVEDPTAEEVINMRWMNIIIQISMFLVPWLLCLFAFGMRSVNGFMLGGAGLMLLAGPLYVVAAAGWIDIVSQLNQFLIPVGSSLERMVKPMEENATELTLLMARSYSTAESWMVIFTIAIVPAICEELFFRGTLQPILARATRNIHVAIWTTAVIFSLIHFQFYGFLPRVLLGAILGYLAIWSGSLWVSVIAHFANNLLAVLVYQAYGSLESPAEEGVTWTTYAMSFLLFGVMTYWFNQRSKWPWISFIYLGIPEREDTENG